MLTVDFLFVHKGDGAADYQLTQLLQPKIAVKMEICSATSKIT